MRTNNTTGMLLPERLHSLQEDICGPPAYLGILPLRQHCAPDTEQPQHGCFSQSAFQPCSGATSAASLEMSGNLSQSFKWTKMQMHTQTTQEITPTTRYWLTNQLQWINALLSNQKKSLHCTWVLHLYMRSINISGSSWCSFIFTVSDRIMCRLKTRSWTWKQENTAQDKEAPSPGWWHVCKVKGPENHISSNLDIFPFRAVMENN